MLTFIETQVIRHVWPELWTFNTRIYAYTMLKHMQTKIEFYIKSSDVFFADLWQFPMK